MSTRLFVSETETVEVEIEEDPPEPCDRCLERPSAWQLHIDPRDRPGPVLVYYLCAECKYALWGWLRQLGADE